MTECVIGIDAGGTMTKAALFDLNGRELACARSRNVTLFPHANWTERDPEAMWRAAASAIKDVIEQSGRSAGDVAAVSVSGYGSGLYVLDRDGNNIRPGIVSTDSRAAALVAEWQGKGLSDQVEPMISQRIWPGQSLALMGWLARHEPGVAEQAHSVALCKDFLRGRLCGDFSTDPTDAGITGLIDIVSGEYLDDVLRVLDMPIWIGKTPAIGPADGIAGHITAEAAALTGLVQGTPVVRGALDVAASAMASGCTQPQHLSVVAGTFSINSTIHQTPRSSIPPFLQMAYPLGGFLATEGAATSASNLEWLVKSLLLHGDELSADDIYDKVNAAVARKTATANDALFFPYLYGGPGGAPAGLVGMNAGDDFDSVLQTVFEGIVFAHKMDIDRLLSGPDAARPEVIRFAGGASKSLPWSDMFADVLNLPVEVPECSELGALGVAICAAKAIGAYASLDDAIAAMARTQRRHEVDRDRGAGHLKKYPKFAAMSEAMAKAWREAEPLHA